MVEIYKLAAEIFGDEKKVQRWLEKPCRVLGGRKPNDLLDSPEGIRIVEDELNRILHGVYY